LISTPKTIQIFLPGGDPRGIRIAEITTRIVQLIEVPRSLLPDFLSMPVSQQVALYFLFGESEEGGEKKVYIGQSGDLRARLIKHNKEKAFWERALVLISGTNTLTQTHTLFLEWHCLQAARESERYLADNGNSGSKPYTPAPLEADCIEIYETGRTLLATLGYPVFEPVARSSSSGSNDEVYYCKASGTNGRGIYTEEGFVILKGSVGRAENAPSIRDTSIQAFRQSLIDAGVMRVEGATVVFDRDHLFRSPSAAGQALLGRTSNGWIEWKNSQGKTLDEVKRQIEE
jgi:hypothetical protein